MTALAGFTEVTDISVHVDQVRVTESDARAALERISGRPAVQARARLRFGPGRTCEPIARVLDEAITRASEGGLDVDNLVVAAGQAEAGEDIVRIRREAHGVADWIHSATTDVTIVLRPAGLASLPDRTPLRERTAPSALPEREPEDLAALSVREELYDVIDPDLGVNIVDLGFIRHIGVDNGVATITMTLTSAACPLSEVMERNISGVLEGTGIRPHVEWEWVPCWSPKDISEDGREQLRAIGFSAF
ncbi:uL22 family ribosomal protein [Brevibacterium oceani]|uniref:uL22 family ribosomal protein n=1 Tax=Brevibacterium oceani TaxID=358099 RepID=UPI001B333A26|nr:uL22 family ribosomal protein [Brevibacterium oceani]